MPHITDGMKSPAEYADEDPDHNYDCSLWLGPFLSPAPWSMYSYERPSNILWSSIAAALYRKGWTDDEIKSWLKSKETRWALDGELGDALIELGTRYAEGITK